jgi:hypothetical protein
MISQLFCRAGRIFALLESVVVIKLCVGKLEIQFRMISERRGIAVIPPSVHIYQIPEVSGGNRIAGYDHVPDTCFVKKDLAGVGIDTAVSSTLRQTLVSRSFSGQL